MKHLTPTKPLVYLGCALSHAPQSFLEDFAYIREQLLPHAEILDFLGLKHPSVGEVFQYDTNAVRRCDLFIANATYPSIGLGLEFGIAYERAKPIITLADDKLAPQRLLVWGHWDPRHFRLRYQTRKEAAQFVIQKIHQLFPDCPHPV